ncbi:hypothetical protein [Streptomyces sp. NBC_01304]|uniref:hypothetical protein n=1 Tax=Streptomyces sp. NBC_01304 TaxID=2903818 RepID=UPI002E0FB102|nr:hypothetical protein OG430_25770 [Streptomyces sp. NBC_01304]
MSAFRYVPWVSRALVVLVALLSTALVTVPAQAVAPVYAVSGEAGSEAYVDAASDTESRIPARRVVPRPTERPAVPHRPAPPQVTPAPHPARSACPQHSPVLRC